MDEAQRLWTTCTEAMRATMSDAAWRNCFAGATPLDVRDDSLVVGVSSTLVLERIANRWTPALEEALAESEGKEIGVELVVLPGQGEPLIDLDAVLEEVAAGAPGEGGGGSAAVATAPVVPAGPRVAAVEVAGAAPSRTKFLEEAPAAAGRFTFEAFVTGDSNRFAHAAAMAVAERPATSYNPLFIYGVAGLGKTHLLHAIGEMVTRIYPTFQVRYVSLEAFMNEFVDSIRTNSGMAFKRRYRGNDVLLVDDIQFLEGKERLQEEFFYTFDGLHSTGRQIVLSSDRPPRAIATLEERLRSRFEQGLITDIQPPDLETRLAILRKKAEPLPTEIPAEVLDLIATAITNNIRELEGALTRVSAFASLNRAPLSEDVARMVLSDVLKNAKPRAVTLDEIMEATSVYFGHPIEDLRGHSRVKPLVNARQVGMYICRQLTDLSYPAIAREYGGRDHTTVIHAVDKIEALMAQDHDTYDKVTELMDQIRAPRA